MAIVAGIDEAGFGPVLGPLVVSATAFRVDEAAAGRSLWKLLAGAVRRKPSKRRRGIAVNDSKKLYAGLRGACGLEHLERGVLTMLGARGERPRSVRELLAAVCPDAARQAGRYPWYTGLDAELPSCLTATDVGLWSNALSACMRKAGVACVDMRSECLFVGEYNRLVGATRNKSSTLFDVTCRLLARLWRVGADERLIVHVDRHGGRTHYLSALQRLFPGARFKVLDESETLSAYRVQDRGRAARLLFAPAADQRELPTALASMLSKYLRELFMAAFNRFWTSRVPQVRPTAGYYTDGRRFFEQIRPAVDRLGVDVGMVFRSR